VSRQDAKNAESKTLTAEGAEKNQSGDSIFPFLLLSLFFLRVPGVLAVRPAFDGIMPGVSLGRSQSSIEGMTHLSNPIPPSRESRQAAIRRQMARVEGRLSEQRRRSDRWS
jgi:hypothetical protein